jgi:hypothetical protein
MLPLAYSSNLHAAETISALVSALGGFSQGVREDLGWRELGIDMRLGSGMIHELADAHTLSQLQRALNQAGCDAFTFNAFPLRPFQAAVVKRNAYLPDWTSRERLEDTLALIPLVCALSDHPLVTISTVPGTYRPLLAGAAAQEQVASALGRWAAAAARWERQSGRTVVLCLEPEPWCMLETSWDVAAFWQGPLARAGLQACSAALDQDPAAARGALARHLGICFDTCHISLAFEDQAAAATRMASAGATIAKCQFSAAPEVADPGQDPAGVAELSALAEPRFMHQTSATSASGSIAKVEDLDQLEDCLRRLPNATRVRSHFHIPVFRAPSERGLSTTVTDSLAGLQACIGHGCQHLAVETYTWSILASHERDARQGTARELAWMANQLHRPS